jgi:hypothetical protein
MEMVEYRLIFKVGRGEGGEEVGNFVIEAVSEVCGEFMSAFYS